LSKGPERAEPMLHSNSKRQDCGSKLEIGGGQVNEMDDSHTNTRNWARLLEYLDVEAAVTKIRPSLIFNTVFMIPDNALSKGQVLCTILLVAGSLAIWDVLERRAWTLHHDSLPNIRGGLGHWYPGSWRSLRLYARGSDQPKAPKL
jgi:hypothetical protein